MGKARQTPKKLTPEERDDLIADVVREVSTLSDQVAGWVKHTHHCAAEVASHGRTAHHGAVAIFWIRIFGVLFDIKDFVDRSLERPSMVAKAVFPEMRDAIGALRALYDDDDLLWLEYRRNVEAHPFQSGYGRLARDGRERPAVKSKLLSEVPTKQANRRLEAFIIRHRHDERAIAIDFATRAVEPLGRLLTCAEKYRLLTASTGPLRHGR